MSKLTESDVRRVVREELASMLGTALRRKAKVPRATSVIPSERGLVGEFLATLAPGERVGAMPLYQRWLTWARGVGADGARVSAAAFGRLVAASGRAERGRDAAGRFYVVLPTSRAA